jgi:adenine/guanine phosphoribosyltransferase-like PRPP-binding protein
VEQCGATVMGTAFLIELKSLGVAKRLEQYDPFSLIEYE